MGIAAGVSDIAYDSVLRLIGGVDGMETGGGTDRDVAMRGINSHGSEDWGVEGVL